MTLLTLRRAAASCVLLLALFALALAQQLTVVSWNVESGGSDDQVIRTRMAGFQGVDLWGLSEVAGPASAGTFELGAEDGEGADFERVVSTTGGGDRLAIIFNSARFRRVRSEELSHINQGNHRAPLVAELEERSTGKRFLFMVNHLARGNNHYGGWVVAAYVGGARTAASPLTVAQPALGNDLTFGDVRFRSRSLDPPLYYGLRGGYFTRRAPSFGVEAEFIHLKVFSNPRQRVRVTGLRRGAPISGELPLGEIVQQYSISHGVNLLLFNAALCHGVRRSADAPGGRLILTGRAGAGPTLPHTESSVEGQRQEQYEVGRLGWQLAGGAEFKLWGGLYALGEYKFTRTRQRGKVFSGTAESLLRTHHGVFGLSYHF